MSLAGFDRLLGARACLLAASLMVGCSGGADDLTTGDGNGDAQTVDSTSEGATESRLDAAGNGDASIRPAESGSPDASMVSDAFKPDVAADTPELPVCLRLADPQNPNRTLQLSQAVGDRYLGLIHDDCRVGKAVHPPGGTPVFATWRNDLYTWNLNLWGCTDKVAVGFGLVGTAFAGVTTSDAAQLIELYLNAATTVLELTSGEAAALRRHLEQLAKPAATNESAGFSLSECVPDAGTVDAPALVDVGSEASDAGVVDADAGVVDADAGVVDADAGPMEAEAGSVDTDAEVDAADEGGD